LIEFHRKEFFDGLIYQPLGMQHGGGSSMWEKKLRKKTKSRNKRRKKNAKLKRNKVKQPEKCF